MTHYADCSFCGGEVTEKRIEYDYRRKSHLVVISNVPAGVCGQCGEKYFKPEILKKWTISITTFSTATKNRNAC
jgi:YgiT-type zinc finger domain-containing protein